MSEATKETPITPPSQAVGNAAPVSDQDLLALQKDIFQKKETPKPDTEKKAAKFIEGAEKLNGAVKEKPAESKTAEKEPPEKSDEGVEFDGEAVEFDASRFLPKEQAEEPEESVEEPEPGEDEPEFTKETNIQNLRKVAGNFKKERDSAFSQIEDLKKQLEERPEPTGLQTTIDQLQARVSELEQYEMVFNLHNNPAFKEKFVDKPNQVVEEMRQIAKDYDVETEVVEDILLVNNRKELDSLLEDHFNSSMAQNDLKTLKQKYDGILREKAEFEKKPQEALTKFHSTLEEQKTERNRRRDEHLQSIMSQGWGSAIGEVAKQPKEFRIYELIEQPGKKDHNEKVVKPTLKDAQQYYQNGMDYIEKLVRAESVPTLAFTKWFAQICQQAAATQMVNHTRWGIYNQYQSLLKDQGEQRQFDRPGVASQGKAVSSSKKGKKLPSEKVAAEIWSNIVGENA